MSINIDKNISFYWPWTNFLTIYTYINILDVLYSVVTRVMLYIQLDNNFCHFYQVTYKELKGNKKTIFWIFQLTQWIDAKKFCLMRAFEKVFVAKNKVLLFEYFHSCIVLVLGHMLLGRRIPRILNDITCFCFNT